VTRMPQRAAINRAAQGVSQGVAGNIRGRGHDCAPAINGVVLLGFD
jgi:hypothetical protein